MLNETLSFGGRQVGLGECPIIRPDGIWYDGRKVISLNPALSDVGVGAMERTNPLPAGRYWVDVFAPQEDAFQAWLQKNKANVAVTTTETFDPIDGYPGRVWRLFEVSAPVTWEGPGFPTIAGADVQTAADTVQRPDPQKDPLDKLSDYGANVGTTAKAILWVVGGVVVLVVGGVIITRYLPAPRPAPLPAPAPARV